MSYDNNSREEKQIVLSKLMFSGLPTVAHVNKSDFEKNALYQWFYADSKTASHVDWNLIYEGLNKRVCMLNNEHIGNYIKVVYTPSEDKSFEVISENPVLHPLDLNMLPMTKRHQLTTEKLNGNNFRVVTYNLLADAYNKWNAESFPYCPSQFVDFSFRRILLLHELLNYNADILFLQECDEEFFYNDLKSSFGEELNYSCYYTGKKWGNEGEAILFRNDRFRLFGRADIIISDQLFINPLYEMFWQTISQNDAQLKQTLENRNNVLQVVLVESIDKPGELILLANTHLYSASNSDFVRLIQSIVILKHLESLFNDLKQKGHENISVFLAGDFNLAPNELPFSYITTQKLPLYEMQYYDWKMIDEFKDLFAHQLNLTAYTNFDYTHFVADYKGVLDFIFYDTNKHEISCVIPMPTHQEVVEHTALPSKTMPSDHIAVVFQFKWKN